MMENTWYSVISPESCSSILWKTWDYKEQAADALRLTADDLTELGIIDGVIKEPKGGAHRDHDAAAELVKATILDALERLGKLSASELIDQRIAKYSAMGHWTTV
jgi:acetyl-CoA carboxylase carboxyl transferase subunit alpha